MTIKNIQNYSSVENFVCHTNINFPFSSTPYVVTEAYPLNCPIELLRWFLSNTKGGLNLCPAELGSAS